MNRNWLLSFFVLCVLVAFGLGVRHYRSAGQMDIAKPGKPINAAVIVPSLSSIEQQGEILFNASCAACHGQNAAGQEGVAPPLVHIIYEPNHHSDQSFLRAAKLGVRQHHWRFGNMPPVANVTDDDVQKIIIYVRALQRENGVF
jgi:mono/diheme cytochrome c family protein